MTIHIKTHDYSRKESWYKNNLDTMCAVCNSTDNKLVKKYEDDDINICEICIDKDIYCQSCETQYSVQEMATSGFIGVLPVCKGCICDYKQKEGD